MTVKSLPRARARVCVRTMQKSINLHLKYTRTHAHSRKPLYIGQFFSSREARAAAAEWNLCNKTPTITLFAPYIANYTKKNTFIMLSYRIKKTNVNSITSKEQVTTTTENERRKKARQKYKVIKG